jgi:predicted XRE-type DNA-binding protein
MMIKSAFHELELQNADELVTKSRLMHLVTAEIRKRGVTQSVAGEILNLGGKTDGVCREAGFCGDHSY